MEITVNGKSYEFRVTMNNYTKMKKAVEEYRNKNNPELKLLEERLKDKTLMPMNIPTLQKQLKNAKYFYFPTVFAEAYFTSDIECLSLILSYLTMPKMELEESNEFIDGYFKEGNNLYDLVILISKALDESGYRYGNRSHENMMSDFHKASFESEYEDSLTLALPKESEGNEEKK